MKRVVIVGAGGHAREVAEVLRQSRPAEELTLLGFVVDEPHLHSESVNGLPVLGDWSWFGGTDRRNLAIICAVGSPKIRKQLVERAMALGLSFARAVSLSAHVSPDAKIGDGVMMLASSVASTDCVIGEHAIVNVGATLSHDARLGAYATINPGVHLAGNVSIGEGCYIGLGANVIQGVSIGAWTTVGAGAVVISDLPENVTAVGIPARIIKTKELT